MKTIYIVCLITLIATIVVMPVLATTETFSTDKDVYIDECEPDENCDDWHDTFAIISCEEENNRGLIHFDLSLIPSDATIDSATLHLFMSGVPFAPEARTHNVHRITTDWTETGVTWNSRDGTTNWGTAGGDYEPTPIDSALTGTTADVWLEWDVKTDVQAFVDDTSNYGWLIKDTSEDDGGCGRFLYRSREYTDTTKRPYLEVTYTEEAPGLCGDVNKDTSVDFIDVGLVGRHKLYGDALADEWAADVNGDDSIDFIDVGLIGRHKLYGDALCCK